MKICPNCHSEMNDNVKFCTKCGTNLTSVAVTSESTSKGSPVEKEKTVTSENVTNKTVNNNGTSRSTVDTVALQNTFQGYWNWLVNSWKSPFRVQKTTKYAGIVTLFLESLFFTLGIGHLAQKATSAVSNTTNNVVSAFSGNSSSNVGSSFSIGFDFYLAIILIILIAAIAMIGIAFLINHAVGGTETFIDYLNRFVHYSNSILILTLIFFLMTLLGSVGIVSIVVTGIILLLISLIWSTTIICGVVILETPGQLDRIYGAVIAGTICVVIQAIAVSLVTSKLGDTLGSFISSFF
ncbi:MAG: zinc ribbon domain-containing protein [Liquorilactobacillus ghanensis]|uniref:DUF6574 domain-containing protein n=1 Tax=Liquorilactobacillus ghanensis TaxID=399370 RepID=UPI0039EAC69C